MWPNILRPTAEQVQSVPGQARAQLEADQRKRRTLIHARVGPGQEVKDANTEHAAQPG